jgi:cytochrome c oxidase subunit IV
MTHPSNDPLPPNSPVRAAVHGTSGSSAAGRDVVAASGSASHLAGQQHGVHHGHGSPAAAHAASAHAVAAHPIGHGVDQHGNPTFHPEHPTAGTYVKVGVILTVITIIEVAVYYIPGFTKTKIFIPLLLLMSAAKFAIVVMFYMHLKYDHKLFRSLFVGPFLIAAGTLVGLLFLFGKLAVRLGLLT